MSPRTPADALAEAKSAHAFYQRELDYFAIGRTPRPLGLPECRADVVAAARIVMEDHGERAAGFAREAAAQSGPREVTATGEHAAYFWTLVACAIETGVVR